MSILMLGMEPVMPDLDGIGGRSHSVDEKMGYTSIGLSMQLDTLNVKLISKLISKSTSNLLVLILEHIRLIFVTEHSEKNIDQKVVYF